MPHKSGHKWSWGNIKRSSKDDLRKVVYGIWMKNVPQDDPLRPRLEAMASDENDMAERFSQDMVFGTAGLPEL